ncbi:acyl carrier protein [Streptomyces sp. NPDC058301]|uniref:acyl carrier protein n=1 Tax=Streptomyces sp. NPDC058301 TaxID=3346436 RepID=UPI0036EAC9C3
MATSERIVIAEVERQRMKELVCEILELDPEGLTDSSLFKEHGADSLGLLEIHASLEQEFSISLEQLPLQDLTNLTAVYAAVATARGLAGEQ